MKSPKSNEKIALRIASYWKNRSGNIVLVAPPLTTPESMFSRLCDPYFLSEVGIDEESLAIAYLKQTAYSNTESFINVLLKEWGLEAPRIDDQDQYSMLRDAVEQVGQQGRFPILIMSNFHKAINLLSWELGANLRQLEADYGISTIVQLPVPLSRLRDRWELDEDKQTFMCSDFGQGHNVLTLGSYVKEEVAEIVKEAGFDVGWVDSIMQITGGIPELVRWALNELGECSSEYEFSLVAKQKAKEQCYRFVDWLDAPNENVYLEAVANIKKGLKSEHEISILREHDWSSFLVKENGELKSDMIGYACINLSQNAAYIKILHQIRNIIESLDFEAAEIYFSNLPAQYSSDNRLNILKKLIQLHCCICMLAPDWGSAKKIARSLLDLCKKPQLDQFNFLLDHLETWKEFSTQCEQWKGAEIERKQQDCRFSDLMCGRDPAKTSELNSLRVIGFKLQVANRLANQDHAAALKTILELPEQMLQIYCAFVLNLETWAVEELDSSISKKVNELWKSPARFRVPPGKRMSLVSMIYVGWVMMEDLAVSMRLFDSFDEAKSFYDDYAQLRNSPSHGVTEMPISLWIEHKKRCENLLARLVSAVLPGTASLELEAIDNIARKVVDEGIRLG